MEGEPIERRCHGTSPIILDDDAIELDECDTIQPSSTQLSEAIEQASPHQSDVVNDDILRLKITTSSISTNTPIVDDWYLRIIILQNITSYLYRALRSTSQRGRQKYTSPCLDRLRNDRCPHPPANPPLNGTRITYDGNRSMHDSNCNTGRVHYISQTKGSCHSLRRGQVRGKSEAHSRFRYQRWIRAAVLMNVVTTTAATKFTLFQNENLTQGVIEQPLTLNPTLNPTSSMPTPLPTPLASNPPSLSLTLTPTISPTNYPTAPPTQPPTNVPTSTPTNYPSGSPTNQPTDIPTTTPTMTHVPTSTPTIAPTSTPSTNPSPSPSSDPTAHPTSSPTRTPTNNPTNHPTYNEPEIISQRFLQTYLGANLVELDPDQQRYFQNTIISYTQHFAPNSEQDYVATDCIFEDQVYSRGRRRLESDGTWNVRFLSVKNFVEVDFTVVYTSTRVNVTEANYPDLFKNFMNSEQGKSRLRINLQSVGVAIDSVEDVRIKVENPPTAPPQPLPTVAPTIPPTIRTALPTSPPSFPPTISPASPSPTKPSNLTTTSPELSPTPATSPGPPVPLIASISSAAFATLLAGFIFCYVRPQKKKRRKTVTNNRNVKNLRVDVSGGHGNDVESAIQMENFSPAGSKSLEGYQSDDDNPVPESLLSNDSLLSFGHSMSSDSILERDETNLLADEFDQYKNPDLEKMRSNVEGSVVNSDGMMSQALTRALMMDDEDSITSDNELRWGGDGDAMEIEASVLCETNDWLKRKEGASLEERRAFMQDALNKMVASVRHNIIAPEEASRTIHGCAAMLGLQLAENIPETALIVTGMRKTVQRKDVVEAFKAFGDIEDAAVAPRSRGFGLVRYKSAKSVQRAIAKFKKEEIVVQDVAVMVRVLFSKQDLPSSQPTNPPPNRPNGPSRAPSRDGMAAHHGSNLESLPYAEDSLGGGKPRQLRREPSRESRAPGSDSGTSVASQRSRHSRDPSAASSSVEGRMRRLRSNDSNLNRKEMPGGKVDG